jgi:hypothetical protein
MKMEEYPAVGITFLDDSDALLFRSLCWDTWKLAASPAHWLLCFASVVLGASLSVPDWEETSSEVHSAA